MKFVSKVICFPFDYENISFSKDTKVQLVANNVFIDHDKSKLIGKIDSVNMIDDCLYASMTLDDKVLNDLNMNCDSICKYEGVGTSLGGWYVQDENTIYIEEISLTANPVVGETLGSHFFIKMSKNMKQNSIIYSMEDKIAVIVEELSNLSQLVTSKFSELEQVVTELQSRVEKLEGDMKVVSAAKTENEVLMSKYRQSIDEMMAESMSILKDTIASLKNLKTI